MSAVLDGSEGSEKLSNLGVGSPPFRKDEWRNREGRKVPNGWSSVETAVRTMDYRFCARPMSLYMMTKKKNRIEIAKNIISNLKREMNKPRLTESVRNERDQAVPVVKDVRAPKG